MKWNKKVVDLLHREILIQQLQRLNSLSPDNATPVAAKQPSCSHSQHALCIQLPWLLLWPRAFCWDYQQESKWVFWGLVHSYKKHRQERKKGRLQPTLERDARQWAFSKAKVPAMIAKPHLWHRDSFMRSPRVTSHFKISRKVAGEDPITLTQLACRAGCLGKVQLCCSHHSQHYLTGRPWGSMAGCVLAHWAWVWDQMPMPCGSCWFLD